MKWVKDKPKEDGWYWYRRSKRYSSHLWEIFFCEVEEGLNYYWQNQTSMALPQGGWWAGPIPLPKEIN